MRRYASIDGPYRYYLERTWGAFNPWLTVVMLNPSTADGEVDDPTIRRCIKLAKQEGVANLIVFNLFAYRATDPKELVAAQAAGEDIIGIGNPLLLLDQLGSYFPIVVAWGAHPIAVDQARWFANAAAEHGKELVCLGTTKSGAPRHPLYVAGNTPLIPWSMT